MPIFAKVIKDLTLPEFAEPIRAGESLTIRFEDPENPEDKGTVYKDNIRVCDVSSVVGEEFLKILTTAKTIKHVATEKIDKLRVIQTEHGFLDDCIDEGIWQTNGEPNYRFTDNPYQAAEFYDDKTVPKYLGATPHRKLYTAQDCADYVGGKLVTIEVTKTVTWEIIG